jgi:hypothetical protein
MSICEPSNNINIIGIDGYETYKIDESTIGIRPKWISVKDKPCELKECLAIVKSEKEKIYNCYARGWFIDTIYSCRMDNGDFMIESHGTRLPATHWMSLPPPPSIP